MPCRTDDHYEDSRIYTNNISRNQYDKLKKEADEVTRLLCSVMDKLERFDFPMALSLDLHTIQGLNQWWKEHQEIDRERIEKEVTEAEKSLSGLSEEAKALLIKKLQG